MLAQPDGRKNEGDPHQARKVLIVRSSPLPGEGHDPPEVKLSQRMLSRLHQAVLANPSDPAYDEREGRPPNLLSSPGAAFLFALTQALSRRVDSAAAAGQFRPGTPTLQRNPLDTSLIRQ